MPQVTLDRDCGVMSWLCSDLDGSVAHAAQYRMQDADDTTTSTFPSIHDRTRYAFRITEATVEHYEAYDAASCVSEY